MKSFSSPAEGEGAEPPNPQLGLHALGDEAIKGDVRLRTLWLDRDAYLLRKHSQRSLQDEMDLRGNPQSHRQGSPFVAIRNQLAMTCPSPPAARTSIAYCCRNSTGSEVPS
jgi:hypothetical protein